MIIHVVISPFCLLVMTVRGKVARVSLVKVSQLRVCNIITVKVKVQNLYKIIIKCGFNFINYYRQNLLKRSFCHIVFMWERDISHQYPSVKRNVQESARYVTYTQLEKLNITPEV